MPKNKIRDIGRCIYCGTTEGELTEEHIMPEGLGGEFTLTKASCLDCNGITSRFELDVLRNLFAPIRSIFKLSKHKNYLKSYPIIIEKNGKETKVDLDPNEFGIMVHFPHFESPAYLSGKAFEKGVMLNGQTTHILPSVEHFEAKIKEVFNPESYRFDLTHKPYKPGDFAKFLAKVAYGFTVARIGLEGIENAYVLPAILNHIDDIGNWVGCNADAKEYSTSPESYEVKLNFCKNANRDILVEIKLFGNLSTPTYLVVVGKPRIHVLKDFGVPE